MPSNNPLPDLKTGNVSITIPSRSLAEFVVEAFTNIPSRRISALEGILNKLTIDEWRFLKSQVDSKTLCRDIVGSLPLELVTQIFSYLDVATPFRLQRVSKHWNRVLTSPDFLNPRVNSWCTPNDTPLNGEAALQADPYALCTFRAQHQHRFATASPFGYLRIPREIDIKNCWLCGDHILCTPANQPRHIDLQNLRTGKRWRIRTEGRAQIVKAVLSDQLAVYVTYHYVCYAFNFITNETRSFRLPKAMFDRLVCRDSLVACSGVVQGKFHISMWDFDTQETKTFVLNSVEGHWARTLHREIAPPALYLDPDSGGLWAFSGFPLIDCGPSNPSEGRKATIYCYELSLKGKSNPRRYVPRTLASPFEWDFEYYEPVDVVPVDREGNFVVHANCVSPIGLNQNFPEDKSLQMQLTFDRKTAALEVLGTAENVRALKPAQFDAPWKDVSYRISSIRTVYPEIVCYEKGANLWDLEYEHQGTLKSPSLGQNLIDGPGHQESRLFVNDHFVVVFHGTNQGKEHGEWDSIDIWTFDSDVKLGEMI